MVLVDTSRQYHNDELGLEALSYNCWFWKLTFLYKYFKRFSPQYFIKYLINISDLPYQFKVEKQVNLKWFATKTGEFRILFTA